MSSAIAVNANTASLAIGLRRSRRPGKTLTTVVSQMAPSGVRVLLDTCPKYPPSGKPEIEQIEQRKDRWIAYCTMIPAECINRPRRGMQDSLRNGKRCQVKKRILGQARRHVPVVIYL
jgi:hypothetical protein